MNIHRHPLALASVLVAVLVTMLSAEAWAAEPVRLGGRQAATVNLTATQSDIADQSTVNVFAQLNVTKISPTGRFEYGVGLSYLGVLLGTDNETSVFIPQATGRINTDAMGAEENIIAYVGGNLGVAIVAGPFDDTSVSGGPKAGIEYYFTPDVAIQAEYFALLQEDFSGSGVLLTNTISLGLRVLF